MILPDVDVLVYAFRKESEHHRRYATWLAELVGGSDELALHDLTLTGTARIATNPRIYAEPAPMPVVVAFLDRLRNARRARWLASGRTAWRHFDELAAADRGVRGNLVPDAFLAALALAHGCRIATADRGFARFPGLVTLDPAA